jgi:hypothetical protein
MAKYRVCGICKQRVRAERFETHVLKHWTMSQTLKSFKEYLAEAVMAEGLGRPS